MDARLRQLQREASTGDLQARAKLLLGRVRAGELSEERLRLAAYLGDPASREALGEGAPEALQNWRSRELNKRTWAQDISRDYGEEGARRMLVAVMRESLSLPFPTPAEYLSLLESEEDLVACPCEQHRERAMDEELEFWRERAKGLPAILSAVVGMTRTFFTQAVNLPESSDYPAAGLRVANSIRTELIPWALGERDPVRERVEARRGSGA